MIAYAIVKETLHSSGTIRYFLRKEDADAFKEDNNSDIMMFPRYYVEAILVEECYNRKEKS